MRTYEYRMRPNKKQEQALMHPGEYCDTILSAKPNMLAASLLPSHLTTLRNSVLTVVRMCKSPSVSVCMYVLSVATLPTVTRMLQETSCNAACRFWRGRRHRRVGEKTYHKIWNYLLC